MDRFKTELESSEHAISMQKNNFTPPPLFATKDLKEQLQEINGKKEFDKNEYHNARYNDLMKSIIPIRKEFPKTKDIEARKEMAKQEFQSWNTYLQERKQDLPKPDFEIDQKEFSMIKENFDRFKDRKTHRVKSEEMVDLHYDFAKKFKFRVPLHPKNMQQMIHPHFGYLCHFQNKDFSWEELVEVYNNQIVSSYERSLGQELLADELASLSYWLIQDTEKKGFFTFKEVQPLLEAFRFDTTTKTLNNFKKEFKFALQ